MMKCFPNVSLARWDDHMSLNLFFAECFLFLSINMYYDVCVIDYVITLLGQFGTKKSEMLEVF